MCQNVTYDPIALSRRIVKQQEVKSYTEEWFIPLNARMTYVQVAYVLCTRKLFN